MKRIVCFGDSNTWGFIACSDHQRYDENTRWTGRLQKLCKSKAKIIEEGLNSRTLMTIDNKHPNDGLCGYQYLMPCLLTHDKIDVFVLMLGTNDLKTRFENSVEKVEEMFEEYVKILTNFKSRIDGEKMKLVVLGIAPICAGVEDDVMSSKYTDSVAKRNELVKCMKAYCKKKKVLYIDNNDLPVGNDGVHISKEGHKLLADKVYKALVDNNLI